MYKVTVYMGRHKFEYFYSISSEYIQRPEFGVMTKLNHKMPYSDLFVIEYDILNQIFGKCFDTYLKKITRVQFDRIDSTPIVIKSEEFYYPEGMKFF